MPMRTYQDMKVIENKVHSLSSMDEAQTRSTASKFSFFSFHDSERKEESRSKYLVAPAEMRIKAAGGYEPTKESSVMITSFKYSTTYTRQLCMKR